MAEPPDTYVHGHHESVLRSHTWRTVENSAGYLIDALEPGADVLDVACGPGTITVDLAGRVGDTGSVVGVDAASDVIQRADALLAEGGSGNCRFEVADVYELRFADDTFDIAHAHQLLKHLTDPVAALLEMARVTKPGGLIAVSEADYGGMIWAPRDGLLDRWMALYHDITDANEVQADAGRYLLGWAQHAGLTDIHAGSSTWTFATDASRAWWSELWADRVVESSYATEALRHGLSSVEELAAIADAWRRWATQADAYFVVPHGELLITVS